MIFRRTGIGITVPFIGKYKKKQCMLSFMRYKSWSHIRLQVQDLMEASEATEVPVSLSPYSHIANNSTFQHYECTICYQVEEKMYTCKGPCHKIYCPKCVGKIKYLKNQCPNKCSKPFLFQPLPALPLIYTCPYQPQQCLIELTSPSLFKQHARECPFIQPWAVQHFQKQKQFQCGQGHPLQVITEALLQENGFPVLDFYDTVINDLCWGCKGRDLCRSICITCSKLNKKRVVYCVGCRQIPLTKTKCPLGHSYESKKAFNYGCICDLCGGSGPLKEGQSYSQYTCDIFLCQECYDSLPEYENKEKEKDQGKKKEDSKLKKYFKYLDDLMDDPFDL